MGSTKFPILLGELAALMATGYDLEPCEAARKHSVKYYSFLEEIKAALMPHCGCVYGSWRWRILGFLLGEIWRRLSSLLRALRAELGSSGHVEAWGLLSLPVELTVWLEQLRSQSFPWSFLTDEQVNWQLNYMQYPHRGGKEVKRWRVHYVTR